MNILDQLLSYYGTALIAGVAIAVLCGVLSPLVVLKRLAFVGQGVSHAAFGAAGVVAVLGVLPAAAVASGAGTAGQLAVYGVLFGFCGLAAALMARGGGSKGLSDDTAIGVVLVASMSVGFVLLHIAARLGRPSVLSIEEILFGSMTHTTRTDAAVAVAVCAACCAVLLRARRGIVFWAFDESSADEFGVRVSRYRLLVMLLLACAVVVAMRATGVVLATAMLVIPGAVSLRLSERLPAVIAMSVSAALLGVLGGLVLMLMLDWPAGPCVVFVLCLELLAAQGISAARRGRARSGA